MGGGHALRDMLRSRISIPLPFYSDSVSEQGTAVFAGSGCLVLDARIHLSASLAFLRKEA